MRSDPATEWQETLFRLIELVNKGLIRVLDLAFVRKESAGSVAGISLSDPDGDGTLDLTVFEDASSGLLGDDDLADAAGSPEP